jgi:hypothetical protein
MITWLLSARFLILGVLLALAIALVWAAAADYD